MTMVKKCSICSSNNKPPSFLTINLGHILIMSTWIAGVLVTYGAMNQKMLTYNQQINSLEIRLLSLENNNNNLIAATRDIEWLKRELNNKK